LRRMIADGAIGELRLWRAHLAFRLSFTDPATPLRTGGSTGPWAGRPSPTWGLPPHRPWRTGRRAGIRAVCAPGGNVHPPVGRCPAAAPGDVTVDDAAQARCCDSTQAPSGTMEVARAAVRRPCDFTIEANGSEGTLVFDYARLNELRYGRAGDDQDLYGMRRNPRGATPATPMPAELVGRSGRASANGSSFVNQVRRPPRRAGPARPWDARASTTVPRHRAVCAAIETSAAEDRWVKVSEITPGAGATEPRHPGPGPAPGKEIGIMTADSAPSAHAIPASLADLVERPTHRPSGDRPARRHHRRSTPPGSVFDGEYLWADHEPAARQEEPQLAPSARGSRCVDLRPPASRPATWRSAAVWRRIVSRSARVRSSVRLAERYGVARAPRRRMRRTASPWRSGRSARPRCDPLASVHSPHQQHGGFWLRPSGPSRSPDYSGELIHVLNASRSPERQDDDPGHRSTLPSTTLGPRRRWPQGRPPVLAQDRHEPGDIPVKWRPGHGCGGWTIAYTVNPITLSIGQSARNR